MYIRLDFLWKVVIVVEGCWLSGFLVVVMGFLCILLDFCVWLLVVLMVVEPEFVVGGGDETGFGCGFHVLRIESRW